jgi:membrane protease YdiL (CAAX protease family)
MYVGTSQAQVKQSTAWGSSALVGEHGVLLSTFLHLLPGILTGAVYLALRPWVVAAGYPPHIALVLAIPLAMIPAQLGLLLYLGHKQNGRLSLQGVVLYRERIQPWRYLVYVLPVFAASLVVIAIGSSGLDNALRRTVFAWMPPVDWDLGGGYTRAVLVVSFLLTALFVTLGESAVEELYFRGFLLPRMRYAGRWATPLHSFLFALYHIWMPWRFLSLTIGMLPLVFAVRRTRNIYVGMIVHMLLNSWDVIVGVAFILAMTSG